MRAIVFCFSAPYPVDTGTRLRANSVIKALQDLGYDVTTVSPRGTGDSNEWIAKTLDLAEAISLEPPPRNLLVCIIDKVRTKTGLFDRYTRSPLSPARRERLTSLSSLEPFDVLVTEHAPNTVISNLIPAKLRLLDTFDLMSIHNRKVAAANLFNIQGLLHFIPKIAPIILAAVPDFRVAVTGIPVKQACGIPFINYTGHVGSIQSVHSKSGFAIIGAYDGTGQQLKVVEAMASRLALMGSHARHGCGTVAC